MSDFYLATYCEAPLCESRMRNCAEIELPERFSDLGDTADDIQAWGIGQLESLGWSVENGEHHCPSCTERTRLKDLSGLNPD